MDSVSFDMFVFACSLMAAFSCCWCCCHHMKMQHGNMLETFSTIPFQPVSIERLCKSADAIQSNQIWLVKYIDINSSYKTTTTPTEKSLANAQMTCANFHSYLHLFDLVNAHIYSKQSMKKLLGIACMCVSFSFVTFDLVPKMSIRIIEMSLPNRIFQIFHRIRAVGIAQSTPFFFFLCVSIH